MNNKRFIKSIVFLFAVALLSSCTRIPTTGDSKTMSEQLYNEQFNRDYILFSSNYTIDMKKDGVDYIQFKTNKGKILSNFIGSSTLYFELTNQGDKISAYQQTQYSNGDIYETTFTESKESFYRYFFYDYTLLFDIPYSAWTFNKDKSIYEIENYIVSGEKAAFEMEYASMSVSNNQPDVFYYSIKGVGELSMRFYDIGKTVVNKLEPEIKPFTLKYQCENKKDVEYVIKMFNETLEYLRVGRFLVEEADDNVINVTISSSFYNYRVESYLNLCLTAKSPLVMTNAHNTCLNPIVSSDRPAYASYDTNQYPQVIIPIDNYTVFDQMLSETRNDIVNNNTDYGMANHDESEESDYSYFFYVWTDFDSEICTFENLFSEMDAIKRLVFYLRVTSDDSMFHKGDNHTLCVTSGYMDINGDGIANPSEIETTEFQARAFAYLINKTPNSYNITILED